MANDSQHIVIVSHQRSGTHLTIDTILNNLALFAASPEPACITIDRLSSHMHKTHPTLTDVRARMSEGPTLFKSHTHANIENFFQGSSELSRFMEELFKNSKIIYVHRDGQDVMVSLFHFLRTMNPQLASIDFHDFLRMNNDVDAVTYRGELDRPSYWAFHVESWLDKKDVLSVSFDDLLTDPEAVLKRISDFTHHPMTERFKSVRRSRKGLSYLTEKIRRRMPIDLLTGKKFTSVSFRKGQSGDWVNYFSEDDLAFFQQRAGKVNRFLNRREMTSLAQPSEISRTLESVADTET